MNLENSNTSIHLYLFAMVAVVASCVGCSNGPGTNDDDEMSIVQKNMAKDENESSRKTTSEDEVDVPDLGCECLDPADQDVVDEQEEELPKYADRTVKSGTRKSEADGDNAELKVFFGNLHSHTKYSDGSGLPGEAYAHARSSAELDFLALTEHNHRSAGSSSIRIAVDNNRYNGSGADALISIANGFSDEHFLAIYGQEFSSISKGNHMNVFDVPKVIDDDEIKNGRFDKLLNDWLPANKDSFGELALLQLNHPWSGSSPSSKEYGIDDFDEFDVWRMKLDAQAQLIEVINGPSHDRPSSGPVKPKTINASEFRRYLGMGFHLAPTANQDNHFRTWGTMTDARTGVIAKDLSKKSILSALKNRHVYASLDKNAEFIARIQGKLIGAILEHEIADGTELNIEVSIEDRNEIGERYWVEIFADKIEGKNADNDVNLVATYGPLQLSDTEVNAWSLEGLEFDEEWDYAYMKVLKGDEDDPARVAYLAPIWFK